MYWYTLATLYTRCYGILEMLLFLLLDLLIRKSINDM